MTGLRGERLLAGKGGGELTMQVREKSFEKKNCASMADARERIGEEKFMDEKFWAKADHDEQGAAARRKKRRRGRDQHGE